MSKRRVVIQWTETAKKRLAELPPKARKGSLREADDLVYCDDPRTAHKRLSGPLSDYYRLTYGRYRAIYSVEEEVLANGDRVVYVRVRFVVVGLRKAGDKKDVHNFAMRLLKLGVLDIEEARDEDDASE